MVERRAVGHWKVREGSRIYTTVTGPGPEIYRFLGEGEVPSECLPSTGRTIGCRVPPARPVKGVSFVNYMKFAHRPRGRVRMELFLQYHRARITERRFLVSSLHTVRTGVGSPGPVTAVGVQDDRHGWGRPYTPWFVNWGRTRRTFGS